MSTDHITPTPIDIDPSIAQQKFEGAENVAILAIPAEYGDQVEVLEAAQDTVERFNLQGKYDAHLGTASLDVVSNDPEGFLSESEAAELAPVYKLVTSIAGDELGFSGDAIVHGSILSDKKNASNPNVILHRDGIGSMSLRAAQEGREVKAIRFVYPIGRPGSILHPGIESEGTPFSLGNYIEDPSDLEKITVPKMLKGERPDAFESIHSQVVPGHILVFDMSNSPWHEAPSYTEDGAVLVIDVYEHGEEAEEAA